MQFRVAMAVTFGTSVIVDGILDMTLVIVTIRLSITTAVEYTLVQKLTRCWPLSSIPGKENVQAN